MDTVDIQQPGSFQSRLEPARRDPYGWLRLGDSHCLVVSTHGLFLCASRRQWAPLALCVCMETSSDGFSKLSLLPRVSRYSRVEACEGQTLGHEQALTRFMSQHHGSQRPCIQEHWVSVCTSTLLSVNTKPRACGLPGVCFLILCPSRVVKGASCGVLREPGLLS